MKFHVTPIALTLFLVVSGLSYAQQGVSNLPGQQFTAESGDMQAEIDNLITTAQTTVTSITEVLQEIIDDYDSRQACANLPAGGAFYTGNNCYVPERVDDFYMMFKCDRRNYSRCSGGYDLNGSGVTHGGQFWTGAYCATYCRFKLGYTCVLYGIKERRFGFCARYEDEQSIPVPN